MIYNHQCTNIKLLMIGGSFYGNEMESSSYINNLCTQFTDIQDRLIFTGLNSYEDIPTNLALADVAVLPSV